MLIRTRHIDRPALNKSGQFIAFNYQKGGWCDLVSTSPIGWAMNCSRNPELWILVSSIYGIHFHQFLGIIGYSV